MSGGLYLGLNEILGAHAVLQLESAEEAAVIDKSALRIDLYGRAALTEQVLGNVQPFFSNVLRDGIAYLLFKAAGECSAVKEKNILKPLQ